MSQCDEWIELIYADPKLRIPGESWSVPCDRTDDDHQLHDASVRWLSREATPPGDIDPSEET